MQNRQHGAWEKVVNFLTLIIVLLLNFVVGKIFNVTGMALVLENAP